MGNVSFILLPGAAAIKKQMHMCLVVSRLDTGVSKSPTPKFHHVVLFEQ